MLNRPDDMGAGGRFSRRAAIGLTSALLLPALARPARAGAWDDVRQALFADRPLQDGSALLRLEAPARALDAAIVPVSFEARIPQTPERHLRTAWLVIDENPAPVAGVFRFAADGGRASVATRVRVNSYTAVHLIGETSDGGLWAVESFVKAAGGCSAPGLKDAVEAQARLGRMKFKPIGDFRPGEINRAQLLISHPNYTGMQIDQLSRNWIPPDYVQRVEVRFAGRPVLTVETDISLSEDPSLTFAYVPQGPGEMAVEIQDSNGRRFAESWTVGSGV